MKQILLILTLFGVSALGAAAQEAQAEPASAQAEKALADQTRCPISGKPISHEIWVDYEGQRTYFCCKGCPKKFEQFPDRYLFSMQKAGVQPENVQTTCAVLGRELETKEHFVVVGNKRIYTCCPKCLKKVEADPVTYLDKLEGRKAQTECPVMGGEVDPEVTAVVQGQEVAYCCARCDKKMQADPDKYFRQLDKAGVVTRPAELKCPVSGNAVKKSEAIPVTYKARRYLFCCPKCIEGFVKDPEKTITTL